MALFTAGGASLLVSLPVVGAVGLVHIVGAPWWRSASSRAAPLCREWT